jgi:hypothetical protein
VKGRDEGGKKKGRSRKRREGEDKVKGARAPSGQCVRSSLSAVQSAIEQGEGKGKRRRQEREGPGYVWFFFCIFFFIFWPTVGSLPL